MVILRSILNILCENFLTGKCTVGFVLDVLFYEGSKNDANITQDILDNNTNFNNLLREGYVFIMDRGFRDIVDDVKE